MTLPSGRADPRSSDAGARVAIRGATAGAARRVGDRFRRRQGRGGLAIAFLLLNAAPIAAVVWFFTRPAADRQAMLDKIPSGVATRAATAGIAFAVLLGLVLVVLPGARGAIAGLGRALAWVRSRPKGLRIALFPVEAVLGLLWFLAQILFALDALGILACAAAFLVYVVRILKPDVLGWLPG